MLVGEFSSLWQARTRRAETLQLYLDQRLEHLVRQYYLLRLSHDRLEQELIGRPMSMRDALSTLQEVGSDAQGPETLLRLLAQYCQLETGELCPVADEQLGTQALASLGTPPAGPGERPLVQQAIETRKLCHINQVLADAAAQLLPGGGTAAGPGRRVVRPAAHRGNALFSLQTENLQTINLLLGYYTDGLSMQALARPILQVLPDCPAPFAFEAQRLSVAHPRQHTGSQHHRGAGIFPRAIARDYPSKSSASSGSSMKAG